MVSADDYRAYAERAVTAGDGDAARAHAARELEFARLYADHDRLLAERGALDFGDLVLRAFQLLHERPHVRERVAARFQHVLVDEYQDTNFAQGMLLRLLIDEHRSVTVVGDDDQAIYRFRGASQKNLLDFEREFPDATWCGSSATAARAGASSTRPRRGGASGPDRQELTRRERRARCASGAAAPSARRRRRWPPRPSG